MWSVTLLLSLVVLAVYYNVVFIIENISINNLITEIVGRHTGTGWFGWKRNGDK